MVTLLVDEISLVNRATWQTKLQEALRGAPWLWVKSVSPLTQQQEGNICSGCFYVYLRTSLATLSLRMFYFQRGDFQ